jgi:mannose-6-phosphate isomerase
MILMAREAALAGRAYGSYRTDDGSQQARFMRKIPLYPSRFEPTYQYRLWGGRRLHDLLLAPLPSHGPVGKAWRLSDRDEHASVVADGPLKGKTIKALLDRCSKQMLSRLSGQFQSFPLLLK